MKILRFESSVILEGSKTNFSNEDLAYLFESSVILEGSKTVPLLIQLASMFESSVILEGSKTVQRRDMLDMGLRVVLFQRVVKLTDR